MNGDGIRLKSLLQVINETLRLGNVVGGVFRKALQDVEVHGMI